MAIDKRNVMSWWGTSDLGVFNSQPTFEQYLEAPNTEVCDGNIVATVDAEDEPYMGGSSAAFTVSYKCDRCDNQFYPELPQNAEGVSAMLTAQIAGLDATPLRAAKREATLRERAEQEAWFAQAQADMKAREAARRAKKAEKGVAGTKPRG